MTGTLANIAIIGGGTMGAIIARALVVQRVVQPAGVLVIEGDEHKRNDLAESLGCMVSASPQANLAEAQVVLFCVKPQDARIACDAIRPWIKADQLVISIMAGVTVAGLSEMLSQHKKIVRCMPNLPMKVGRGMTVFFAAPGLSECHLAWTHSILNCCGISLEVKQEELLNASTAINGTGPAYLYYLMEHLLSATCALGFDEAQARILVRQTLQGSLELWDESGISPRDLRLMVTSKGGTTAAAIATFEAGKLGEVLQQGIIAAHNRARELASA